MNGSISEQGAGHVPIGVTSRGTREVGPARGTTAVGLILIVPCLVVEDT